jgi:hypothetical protein
MSYTQVTGMSSTRYPLKGLGCGCSSTAAPMSGFGQVTTVPWLEQSAWPWGPTRKTALIGAAVVGGLLWAGRSGMLRNRRRRHRR